MKKRIIALLLIAAVILSFGGCIVRIPPSGEGITESSENTKPAKSYKGFDTVDKAAFEFESAYYDEVSLTLGYDCLGENERKLYDAIDYNVYYVSEEKDGDVYKTHSVALKDVFLSEAQIRMVISAYFMDNPEVFWIDNNFEYYSSADKTVVQLASYMNAQEITEAAQSMYSKIDAMFAGMGGGLDLFERELYVHDKLVEGCVYGDDIDNISDSFKAFTSYGAIVDGVAVCEGYSRGMQIMLAEVGIEAYNILGIGTDELHMWNCVKLGDRWYYLDATWNDTDDSGRYDYFNITTEQLEDDHTIDRTYWELSESEVCGSDGKDISTFNLMVPECTDDSMTYYAKKGVLVDSLGLETTDRITAALTEAAQNGEDCIFLYIDESKIGYNTAVDELFYGGEYLFFDCIDEANSSLVGTSVDKNNVSIVKSPGVSTVTVYLEYE